MMINRIPWIEVGNQNTETKRNPLTLKVKRSDKRFLEGAVVDRVVWHVILGKAPNNRDTLFSVCVCVHISADLTEIINFVWNTRQLVHWTNFLRFTSFGFAAPESRQVSFLWKHFLVERTPIRHLPAAQSTEEKLKNKETCSWHLITQVCVSPTYSIIHSRTWIFLWMRVHVWESSNTASARITC